MRMSLSDQLTVTASASEKLKDAICDLLERLG